MTDGKLRIPRVAMAVLVLGAACGDDEKSSEERDAGEAGTGEDHTGHDAGDVHEHDAGDVHEHDAGGGDDEPDAGSGEDAGGSTGGNGDGGSNNVDVSDPRLQKVAADFCKQGFACESEEVVGNFDDQADCIADNVTYWQDYVPILGEDCIDSQLDLYACVSLLSCDESVDEACRELIDQTAELCAEKS